MSVAIIDYGSGNLHSAQKAFERACHEAGVTGPVVVTSEPDVVAAADRIVLPGVGAFADCRRGLDNSNGMIEAMSEAVLNRGRPFLGICVGMQLLAQRGLEHEVAQGLGWIAGDVVAIEPAGADLRIPHMGWNTLRVQRSHPVLDGISTGDTGLHAYFVHSFHMKPKDARNVIADTEYGGSVTAIVGRDNIVGSQFHPEKSQKLGLAFIANFLRWRP
ncbi:MAG: imidazole glycerol phosphate synthase subunit HisH [Beijerinckiaceae bacterium]